MKMLNVAKLSRIFERATFYKRRPIHTCARTHTPVRTHTHTHTHDPGMTWHILATLIPEDLGEAGQASLGKLQGIFASGDVYITPEYLYTSILVKECCKEGEDNEQVDVSVKLLSLS